MQLHLYLLICRKE